VPSFSRLPVDQPIQSFLPQSFGMLTQTGPQIRKNTTQLRFFHNDRAPTQSADSIFKTPSAHS